MHRKKRKENREENEHEREKEKRNGNGKETIEETIIEEKITPLVPIVFINFMNKLLIILIQPITTTHHIIFPHTNNTPTYNLNN